MKLAISPIGWTNDDLPELGGHISFDECLQQMAAAGYQGCEVGNKFPRDPKILTAALEPHHLKIVSAWHSLYFTEGRYQETVASFITHMNFLKTMGAQVIVVCECGHSIHCKPVSVFHHAPRFNEDQWEQLIDGLHEIGSIAHAHGMTVAYHHHMGTGVHLNEEIDYLLKSTQPNLLSLVLDTGHLTYAGCNPAAIIRKHGKRIKHVHLKDIRNEILTQTKQEQLSFLESVKRGVFTVPGDGVIDFAEVFKELKTQEYQDWYVVEAEQDPVIANPLDYAQRAYNYLQSFFQEQKVNTTNDAALV